MSRRFRRRDGSRLAVLQNTPGTRRPIICHDDQNQRRNHKESCRDGGGLGQDRGGSARPEDCLRTHTSEGSRQVGRFSALQQNHDDQKKANDDVQNRDEVQHCQLRV